MKLRDDEADARLARTPQVLAYLPWILRYPLSGNCLGVIVMLSLFGALSLKSSMVLPPPLPDTGLPLLVITSIWTLFYLMRVIECSAQGYATPPPMGADVVYLSPLLIFRILLLPALYLNAALWLAPQYPAAPSLFGALAALTVPVYWLILATEDDLAAALNPLRGIAVVLTLGWPYMLACGLLTLLVLMLQTLWGSWATAPLIALAAYLLYASCHLLGYLAYHQHQRLGLQVAVRHPDEVAREREQKDRIDALLVRIENCLLNHDERGAAREIEAETGGPVSVRQSFEDLFTRLLSRGTPLLQHTAGRKLITALLAEQRKERALEVAETCLNKNAHFEPATVLELEQLARQALAGKYLQTFERLLHHLDERYPGDPFLITAQFLRAQARAEQQNDEAGALALLQPLLAHTRHPLHSRIAGYARALQNLQARSTRR